MKAFRAIRWAAVNALFLWLLWLGVVDGLEGAHNVAFFWLWFGIVVSFGCLVAEVREGMQKQGPSVPLGLNLLVDLAIAGFLAWHGYTITAALWVVHAYLVHSAYTPTETQP